MPYGTLFIHKMYCLALRNFIFRLKSITFESKLVMYRNILIGLFFLGYFSCQNPLSKDGKDIYVGTPLIKSCKMYSADFVALNPNDSGQLIQKFNFNRKGFVNELIRYGLNGEVVEKFDILGNNTMFPLPEKPQYMDTVLTTFEMDSLGKTSQIEVKKYNKDGLLIESSYFDGDNKLLRKNTYQYNELRLITKDIYWDVELAMPLQVIRYEYELFKE